VDSGLGKAIAELAGIVAGPARSERRKLNFVMDTGPVFAGA